ncbi:hypothetical protein EVAR_22803_1 [Eumeta japonica]|uniref:Uncharacterized protein n=1 Tax=Eumeta variegata TaxID=151549 RepID=A0A4C1VFD7_EUMVA|nr:hypothetical protein EVAR_22803_1 [Eumeta japonica]
MLEHVSVVQFTVVGPRRRYSRLRSRRTGHFEIANDDVTASRMQVRARASSREGHCPLGSWDCDYRLPRQV